MIGQTRWPDPATADVPFGSVWKPKHLFYAQDIPYDAPKCKLEWQAYLDASEKLSIASP